jgi:uncharacterized protein
MRGNFEFSNKGILTILFICVVLVGGYLALTSNVGVFGSATVSARGESVIEVEPDVVLIYFNLEGRGENAVEAKEAHDEMVDAFLVGLFRIGMERDEVRMVNYNIYPEYDWSKGEREEIGYVARQTLVVELNDFDLVASVVDIGVDAGALVSSIQFELTEDRQSELKVEALEKAGEDAIEKAEATARGLGKSLGRLVSVRSEEFNYGPYRYFEASSDGVGIMAAAEAKDAAINIAPQDLEVRASIAVEYKLSFF